MYWINLIKEFMLWRKVRKIALQNREILEANNLRVDWLGRIYTVVNLPEQIVENPHVKEPYIIAQLREYDEVFLQLGIADILYPEFSQIEGTDSYLLVLYPEADYMSLSRFIWNIVIYSVGTGILYLLFRLLTKHWDSITSFF